MKWGMAVSKVIFCVGENAKTKKNEETKKELSVAESDRFAVRVIGQGLRLL